MSSNLTVRKFSRLLSILKKKGFVHVAYWGIIKIYESIGFRIFVPASAMYFYRERKFGNYFKLAGKEYRYLYHRHNYSWRHERAVEVPIVWDLVKRADPAKVLEVGNVLINYYPVEHDVLDKYEIAKNVINEDVVSFHPKKKYNLIVSISTLEHVGWDEPRKDSTKIPKAIKNLRGMLTKNGKLVFTMPLGYNKFLDSALRNNKLRFSHIYYMKRVSKDNKWIETDWKGAENVKYGHPFMGGNAIVVGIVSSR
jgi:hypothetical protein